MSGRDGWEERSDVMAIKLLLVGGYGTELVHNREPVRIRVTS